MDKGLKRILKAFTYSFDGFKAAFKSEEALRQDLLLCSVLLVISLLLKVTYTEKLILIFSLFMIILMELVNTAIETVVDRISDDYHLLSKKAKDIGSLLVLISFVYAIIAWSMIIFKNC